MEIFWIALVFGWVSVMLASSESSGMPKYKNPPASPKRKGSVPRMRSPPPPPIKKCICNAIEEHSPGGRCEACHSKDKVANKSRLKKCNKGLHEFLKNGFTIIDKHTFSEIWACKHCGLPMHSRNNSFYKN